MASIHTAIANIRRSIEEELAHHIVGGVGASWHDQYKDSAWVVVGGLDYEMTEGDIICVMSQWGEIEDINLLRDRDTGKSKGTAFVKYEDQRSTILAVDNFCGMKLLGRSIKVDHANYKLPSQLKKAAKETLEKDPQADIVVGPGHAYQDVELENEFSISKGQSVWADDPTDKTQKEKSEKKHKKDKKHKKEKRKRDKEEYSDDEFPLYPNPNPTPSAIVNPNPNPDPEAVTAEETLLALSTIRDGAAASWRGVRDPALRKAKDMEARWATKGEEQVRRDEFDSFGGMKRKR